MFIRKLAHIFCSFIFKIQMFVSLPASQKKTRLFPYKTQKEKHGATSTTGRQPAHLLDDKQRRWRQGTTLDWQQQGQSR